MINEKNILKIESDVFGGFWPGIQLYYPPVKYSPSTGGYEDLEEASKRFKKHAHQTIAHTLIFDLEDGCRQKELSRELLKLELQFFYSFSKYLSVKCCVYVKFQ